jgi:hypothetical protein
VLMERAADPGTIRVGVDPGKRRLLHRPSRRRQLPASRRRRSRIPLRPPRRSFLKEPAQARRTRPAKRQSPPASAGWPSTGCPTEVGVLTTRRRRVAWASAAILASCWSAVMLLPL